VTPDAILRGAVRLRGQVDPFAAGGEEEGRDVVGLVMADGDAPGFDAGVYADPKQFQLRPEAENLLVRETIIEQHENINIARCSCVSSCVGTVANKPFCGHLYLKKPPQIAAENCSSFPRSHSNNSSPVRPSFHLCPVKANGQRLAFVDCNGLVENQFRAAFFGREFRANAIGSERHDGTDLVRVFRRTQRQFA